jgi:hypothetical protein
MTINVFTVDSAFSVNWKQLKYLALDASSANCSMRGGLTFDMSGDRKQAKLAGGRPLDGGVR